MPEKKPNKYNNYENKIIENKKIEIKTITNINNINKNLKNNKDNKILKIK